VLLLFTDGLIDAGKEYSTEMMLSIKDYCLQETPMITENLERFIDNLTGYYKTFETDDSVDDVAVMAIKILN